MSPAMFGPTARPGRSKPGTLTRRSFALRRKSRVSVAEMGDDADDDGLTGCGKLAHGVVTGMHVLGDRRDAGTLVQCGDIAHLPRLHE